MSISDHVPARHFAPDTPPATPVRSQLRLRRKLRVLLVEDEAADATLIGELLARSRRFDCAVVLASGLDAARAALDSDKFDLTILDYWIGAESSLGLLDHPAHLKHGLPALLVSAIDVVDVRGAGVAAGARAYLHKTTLSREALDAAMLEALRQEA
jgi:DNA-binding NtrC family response regulator